MALRLIVHGRVQGVGYRHWARQQAMRLGLTGWVRNRSDGTVELVADGAPDAIQAFLGLCERGPAAARVTSIDRIDADCVPEAGFTERPSF